MDHNELWGITFRTRWKCIRLLLHHKHFAKGTFYKHIFNILSNISILVIFNMLLKLISLIKKKFHTLCYIRNLTKYLNILKFYYYL